MTAFHTLVVKLNYSNNDLSDEYFYSNFGIHLRTADPELRYFAQNETRVWAYEEMQDGFILIISQSKLDSHHTSEAEAVEAVRGEINERLEGIVARRNSQHLLSRRDIYQAFRKTDLGEDATGKLFDVIVNLKLNALRLNREYIHIDDLEDAIGEILNGEYELFDNIWK